MRLEGVRDFWLIGPLPAIFHVVGGVFAVLFASSFPAEGQLRETCPSAGVVVGSDP